MASASELACIYSALILHDDEVTVTEDKLNALVKTAGVAIEPFWPSLFAKALANIDVNKNSLICNVGAGSSAPAAAAVVSTAAPVAAEEKKEEKKQEESEESDADMGYGLFVQTCRATTLLQFTKNKYKPTAAAEDHEFAQSETQKIFF
ncbi:60S acidic ribosomal protein P1-like [Scyliorhinus canicula]|uniref:60S acidic ribosomal protein P1-like n=1 Tax=Scyliorhinus canicula TaxID=7830 RepID=UPI0018F49B99|nr:60S acidic ribosomal protein P1-like [Scyliorhinus canicula]